MNIPRFVRLTEPWVRIGMTLQIDPEEVDAEVARMGATGELDSPWRDWDDEEIAREFAPWPTTVGAPPCVRLEPHVPLPVWRVGQRVPRNIYKDDEPIAMLAGEDIAKEIVDLCNEAEVARKYWSDV